MHLTLCQRSALLFSAIFLPTALPTAAQLGSQRNDWAIGANTGLSLNQVSFNPGVRQTYSPGGVWGFTARYTSERYYGLICALQIEAELLASRMERRHLFFTRRKVARQLYAQNKLYTTAHLGQLGIRQRIQGTQRLPVGRSAN